MDSGKATVAALMRGYDIGIVDHPDRTCKSDAAPSPLYPIKTQATGWPEPLDVIGAPELVGWPS